MLLRVLVCRNSAHRSQALNAELVLRLIVEGVYGHNTSVARARVPFCLLSRRDWVLMRSIAHPHPTRGGDYCRPCTPAQVSSPVPLPFMLRLPACSWMLTLMHQHLRGGCLKEETSWIHTSGCGLRCERPSPLTAMVSCKNSPVTLSPLDGGTCGWLPVSCRGTVGYARARATGRPTGSACTMLRLGLRRRATGPCSCPSPRKGRFANSCSSRCAPSSPRA